MKPQELENKVIGRLNKIPPGEWEAKETMSGSVFYCASIQKFGFEVKHCWVGNGSNERTYWIRVYEDNISISPVLEFRDSPLKKGIEELYSKIRDEKDNWEKQSLERLESLIDS